MAEKYVVSPINIHCLLYKYCSKMKSQRLRRSNCILNVTATRKRTTSQNVIETGKVALAKKLIPDLNKFWSRKGISVP